MDADDIHAVEAASGNQLVPPGDARLEGRAADDLGSGPRQHRLHCCIEGGEHAGRVGAAIGPPGVVRLVPRFPVGHRSHAGRAGRHRGVVGNEGGDIGLPPVVGHQCIVIGRARAHLDPVRHVGGGRFSSGLVRIGRGVGEVHGRGTAGRRSRCACIAGRQELAPVDAATETVQAELGVQGDTS